MTPEDHADLIRDFLRRTADCDSVSDQARLLGVGDSTVRRWVAATEAGEEPMVPLTAPTLGALVRFLGVRDAAGSAARLRATAVRLRQMADDLDGTALALERGGGESAPE